MISCINSVIQTRQGHKKFFQVVWKMDDEKTFIREQRALKAGMEELKIDGESLQLIHTCARD